MTKARPDFRGRIARRACELATFIEFDQVCQVWRVFDPNGHLMYCSPSRQVCLDWEPKHLNWVLEQSLDLQAIAMDFFTMPTAAFRRLWVFVVLHRDRRRIVHVAVTEHPEATWGLQQLREAFPFDTARRYAILDRHGKYGHAVPTALQSLGVKPVRTAPRSPWQNP